MSQTRPKPWENSSLEPLSSLNSSADSNSSSLTTSVPSVPPRPNVTSTQSIATNSSSGPNSLHNSAFGSTSHGTYGGGYNVNNFSGINRYGSMGSYGAYGGLGGYGNYSGYGGYGGMGNYGLGGIGMGGMGMNGRIGMNGMNQPEGTSFADATSRTFQVLENVVYAVSAVAALLESTYFATYNSFFTILGVADQLGHIGGGVGGALKDTVTGVSDSVKLISDGTSDSSSSRGPFGIFALVIWLKRMLRRLFGISSGTENRSVHSLLKEFSTWRNGIQNKGHTVKKQRNVLSLRPLLVFLVALIGLPVVMSKFVRFIEQHNQRKQTLNGSNHMNGINSIPVAYPDIKIDPKSLEFARAIYDYIPEREDEDSNGWKELKLLKGNLVAILNNIDGWSNCRTRDGRIGYVPTSYLEVVKKNSKLPKNPVEST